MSGIASRVAPILRQAAGLEVALIGVWSVEQAVLARIGALRADGERIDIEGYLARIEYDCDERQSLIEAVVVPETWFFRHRPAFDFVAAAARERFDNMLRIGPAVRPLRFASVPCSTGEEPYSLAMALLDAGLPRGSFIIDAIDISKPALTRARAGFYGANAFRGHALDERARYFDVSGNGWQIRQALRACVTFRSGNLLEADLLPRASYDFVFCRNVLIYFDRREQLAVMSRLGAALRDDGQLLVGPAETALPGHLGMVATAAPGAFAFHRAPPVADAAANAVSHLASRGASPGTADIASQDTPHAASVPMPMPMRLPRAAPPRPMIAIPTPPRPSVWPAAATELARAEQLANRGQLAAATATCEALLTRHEGSADVYCLLGIIADADARPEEARAHFRRALYLDGAHAVALLHLAEHLASEGDRNGAMRLQSRARRARRDLL